MFKVSYFLLVEGTKAGRRQRQKHTRRLTRITRCDVNKLDNMVNKHPTQTSPPSSGLQQLSAGMSGSVSIYFSILRL